MLRERSWSSRSGKREPRDVRQPQWAQERSEWLPMTLARCSRTCWLALAFRKTAEHFVSEPVCVRRPIQDQSFQIRKSSLFQLNLSCLISFHFFLALGGYEGEYGWPKLESIRGWVELWEEGLERKAAEAEGGKAADSFLVAQFKFIPFVLATQNWNTVLFSIRMYMN